MIAFIFILFTSLIGSTYQWTYDDEAAWPAVCLSGAQQSPIDIVSRDAVVDIHGAHIRSPLVMTGYNQVNMSALNNGHTLKWNVNDHSSSSTPTLSGGPLRGNYTLLQFHLHWLSEHAIDGIKYPLEIHFVHHKAGMTLEEALLRPDGLVVVGVLGEVRGHTEALDALKEIMPDVAEMLKPGPDRETEPNIIDTTRFISAEPQSYYTYHGSLTTPYCNEVVTWIVMDKPISISDVHYKLFSRVDVGGINNYRSLQPTNRVVYRSVASCASIVTPGFIGYLASFFSCFSWKLASAFGKGMKIVGKVKKHIFGDNLKESIKVTID